MEKECMAKDPNRLAREAAALRENLKKRRAQARDRDQAIDNKYKNLKESGAGKA